MSAKSQIEFILGKIETLKTCHLGEIEYSKGLERENDELLLEIKRLKATITRLRRKK